MKKVLVLGATGYIGRKLVPELLDKGHFVRCAVRDSSKAKSLPWYKSVEFVKADALKPDTLAGAFDGIDAIYYLIHSMASGKDKFEELDRMAALNVAEIAGQKNVKQIIYLGGLGRQISDQSPHLRSRHEVGRVLREGPVPVTEFRAAVIIGSGSTSFEMVHHLVNRLPVMICPRWVSTRTQPIYVNDVLKYLVDCLGRLETTGQSIDIGGPDIITYGEMMKILANKLKLKRYLLKVPVLTPRLSSYWVDLVTPIPSQVARALIEGLRYETIRENDRAEKLFDIKPVDYQVAVERELAEVIVPAGEKNFHSGRHGKVYQSIDPSHLKFDRRSIRINVPQADLFSAVASLGGDNGWYFANWLWLLRGFIDRILGGIGMRRGRPATNDIKPGDTIDFWRVVDFAPETYMLLEAEMNVWGKAWLEFELEAANSGMIRVNQTAWYYPRGIFGLIYWPLVYPLHQVVFRGLIKGIVRKAQKKCKDN